MLIIQALWVFGAVTFPMYSLLQHDQERLQRGYLTSARVQSAFGMAVGVGLAVIAPILVPVLFGDRWSLSIVPLQALALYAAFRALGTGITELSNGIGRPGVNVALSLVFLATLAPTLWLSTRYGISVVSWAHAAVALVMALLKQGVAFRLLRLPLRRFAEILAPTLAVGLGTAWWRPSPRAAWAAWGPCGCRIAGSSPTSEPCSKNPRR
jgi:lipopolysaccharide exporter